MFSSRRAKKARRRQPIPEVFLVRPEDDGISVDRMDHASRNEMAAIAAERGQGRGKEGAEFHGWAIFERQASKRERTDRASEST